MRFASILIATASAASSKPFTIQEKGNYLAYIARQGKSYDSLAEFEARLQNWKASDDFIKSHQSTSYNLSHNKFSDYSVTEK